MIENKFNMNKTIDEYNEDNIYLSDLARLMELHNEIQGLKDSLLMHSISVEHMIDKAPITTDIRNKFQTILNNIKENYELFWNKMIYDKYV